MTNSEPSREQLQQQIIDLQDRVTFQEDMLATLNEAIVSQDNTIHMLQHWMKRCQSRLDEVAYGSEEGANIIEPPPPHY